jgi:FeS assembly SUF system regulator
MLRLSKLADYAVVVLIRLAEGERCCPEAGRLGTDAVQTSPGIALATGVPEPTVAKVLKALAGAGLVTSQRGARGGYRLCKPLHAIAISDVITAIDGPIALTACVDGHQGTCDVLSMCAVRGRWDLVNATIRKALSHITLADMRAASVPLAFRNDTPHEAPSVDETGIADVAVNVLTMPAAE